MFKILGAVLDETQGSPTTSAIGACKDGEESLIIGKLKTSNFPRGKSDSEQKKGEKEILISSKRNVKRHRGARRME